MVNSNILELFPTPVFTTMIPENFSRVVNWFYTQQMTSTDPSNYGENSQNNYLLNEPECTDLKNYILQLVSSFGNSLGFEYKEYKFGQSWLSYKHPGQHHTPHAHPNSLISGVMYFGDNTKDTPAIRFHKLSMGVNTPTILPKVISDTRNFKYAQTTFDIQFTPGLLLLFPSYLVHSVPVNNSNKVRCSLAFNAVPCEGFGDDRNLTELKF